MSIAIDSMKCRACGKCLDVCPGSLIVRGEDKKAVIRYPKDCWGCVSCVKVCKVNAIEFFLGEDMGGSDTYMQVETKDHYLDWKFYDSNGLKRTIEVDRTSSNKY